MKPLVSMITYCYNGERFIAKYFEAILAQTYSNVELIFFNNGSEDRTGEIAESYRNALTDKGMQVNIIHYKENQSTCALKQQGFQMMKGNYFFGCDSDDLIDPTYIEEMSGYLEAHPEKGIVYCQLRVVEEETGDIKSIMKMIPRTEPKEAFMDILRGDNINFTAISYMMSRKHFEIVNPTKSIYISRFGENYQTQIPFLYHDLQGYIEKPLGQYTVRRDSYTGTFSPEKRYVAYKGQELAVLATLDQIHADEKYKQFYLGRERRERYYVSLTLGDSQKVELTRKELEDIRPLTIKERISYLLFKLHLFPVAMKMKGMQ